MTYLASIVAVPSEYLHRPVPTSFKWDELHVGLYYAYIGAVIVVVQGGFVEMGLGAPLLCILGQKALYTDWHWRSAQFPFLVLFSSGNIRRTAGTMTVTNRSGKRLVVLMRGTLAGIRSGAMSC